MKSIPSSLCAGGWGAGKEGGNVNNMVGVSPISSHVGDSEPNFTGVKQFHLRDFFGVDFLNPVRAQTMSSQLALSSLRAPDASLYVMSHAPLLHGARTCIVTLRVPVICQALTRTTENFRRCFLHARDHTNAADKEPKATRTNYVVQRAWSGGHCLPVQGGP